MRVLGLAGALLCLLLSVSPAICGKRVALVVGNSDYKHAPQLTNPRNDAADVGAALRRLGLTVIEGLDLDKAGLEQKVREFATALQGADAGILFYAGHGLQVAGQNYLVPVDARLSTAAALDFEMIRLDVIQRIMEAEASTNILFLDACRDNPLARNLARAMGTRSTAIGRGLASIESGSGTLISFSTQPGNVALDGDGRNSPFTSALVRHLADARDDLSAILISVRNDVMQETQRKQVPWEHSALTRRFYFNESSPVASQAAAPATSAPSEASTAWQMIKDSSDVATIEAFRRQYGSANSFFDRLAESRLEDVKRRQTLAALPPQPSPPPNGPVPEPPAMGSWRPHKPITLVVPYAAGGTTDLVGRIVADHMSGTVGQTIVIEDVPGAGGMVGTARIAQAAADGYAILIQSNTLASVPSLYAKPPVDVHSGLAPVGLVAFAPMVMVARKELGQPGPGELLGWLRSRAQRLTIATAGVGSSSHACSLLLQHVLGQTFTQVPYKGTAPALQDVAAGQIDLMCDQGPAVEALIKGGNIQGLFVYGQARMDALPSVPATAELGERDLFAMSYYGLFAPRGTPANVVQSLNAALQAALADKSVGERLAKFGFKPFAAHMRSAAEHAKLFTTEIERQSIIYKSAGVAPQ